MSIEWLSLGEVAELLGVHTSTVRTWADQGQIPVHRTQGGHRRFRRAEVDLWMQSRQAEKSPKENSTNVGRLVKDALMNTRLVVSEGRLEKEAWYNKLDEEAREQYRRGGRSLLEGLINFQLLDEASGKAEARAIGFEYASVGRRCGLSSVDAVHAFLFFRNLLMDGMFSTYESASVRSSRAWGEILRKTTAFTDIILITLLETYEAYQRSNR
jgi:excisionase family DNA binding protein